MVRDSTRDGGRRGGLLLILAAAVAGVLVLVLAVMSQEPESPALESAVGTVDPPPDTDAGRDDGPPGADTVEPARDVPVGPSEPVSISIPAIDVVSEVFPISKTPEGALAVPQPGPNLDKAAWFENSPTPGQPGPSVIEGHVATEESGPSIFFDLAKLRPGDRISVERKDGKTAVFTVDGLREFDKDRFPTELVYGGNLGESTLRVITCSNFDPTVGTHTGNLVVFASLIDVRKT